MKQDHKVLRKWGCPYSLTIRGDLAGPVFSELRCKERKEVDEESWGNSAGAEEGQQTNLKGS